MTDVLPLGKWIVQIVDMKMKNVELRGAREDRFELDEMMRHRINDAFIEAERALGASHQARSRDRIAAGKKGDIVSLAHQLLGEIGDDALGTRRKTAAELARRAARFARFACGTFYRWRNPSSRRTKPLARRDRAGKLLSVNNRIIQPFMMQTVMMQSKSGANRRRRLVWSGQRSMSMIPRGKLGKRLFVRQVPRAGAVSAPIQLWTTAI